MCFNRTIQLKREELKIQQKEAGGLSNPRGVCFHAEGWRCTVGCCRGSFERVKHLSGWTAVTGGSGAGAALCKQPLTAGLCLDAACLFPAAALFPPLPCVTRCLLILISHPSPPLRHLPTLAFFSSAPKTESTHPAPRIHFPLQCLFSPYFSPHSFPFLPHLSFLPPSLCPERRLIG